MQDNFNIHGWHRSQAMRSLREEESKSPADKIYNTILSYLEKNKEDSERFKHAHEIWSEMSNHIKALIIGTFISEDKNTDTSSSLKETISIVMEDLEGFSKYFPGGKTKGLKPEELSTILMKIVNDIEQDGKELDESTLTEDDRCTRIAKRKYDSWPSAYASGAVVRCRKGDIWKDLKG